MSGSTSNDRALANERVVYINGEYLPESRGFIHFRDRGFIYGDAVFDTARTFGSEIYRLEQHVDRLFRSLKYLRIDPGLAPSEIAEVTRNVVQRNQHLLGDNEDYWVFQRISRGSNYPDGPGATSGATVIVECVPLPLAKRARLYTEGAHVIIPSPRRTPPESLSPNAKMQNYLNLIVAGFDSPADDPLAWPVLLDTRGFLSEGSGSNIFLVRDGRVLTPKAPYVLAGISREVVIELCEKLGIDVAEEDLSPYDAVTADEAFLTSTSLCVCPISQISGQAVGFDSIDSADLTEAESSAAGPVTQRLMNAFAEEVGYDYVGQYLAHL